MQRDRFQIRIKQLFHCVNSLGKEKVQWDSVPSTYKTTNNSFSFIVTVYIHASGHSPTTLSSWTQWELQNVSHLQNNSNTNKQTRSPYRASSFRCFHICITPLNVAPMKQKELPIVAKLSRTARECRMSIFGRVNRKQREDTSVSWQVAQDSSLLALHMHLIRRSLYFQVWSGIMKNQCTNKRHPFL